MKKFKKILLLIVFALVIAGVGFLLAYLTDTDEETNVFTAGKVDIELTETNWNPSNGQNILPNQPINKNPKINNIGNNPAYVYIKVVNPVVTLAGGEGVLFNYTVNSGWTQLDQVEQCGYRATTYYYNTSLNPSNSTTTLFDTVTVNEFRGPIASDQVLDIYGYGIQSTYLQSGATVSSLFTDVFTTDLSDTDESCLSALDCNNNEMYTTAPAGLKGLAKIMAKEAYLDNGKSEYISSCNGVDFNDISSDTNGKGIYEIASTKNNAYPIYYYRGNVQNNNVIFGGFCWKAIRTTDTGGVKMIYNGTPDGSGSCTNTTGTSTQIGTSYFNPITGNYPTPTYVGYMYDTEYLHHNYKLPSSLNYQYIYGNDVTYSNGTYTLVDTITATGQWEGLIDKDYKLLNNNHYTCFSTGTTCTTVKYIFYTHYSHGAYYIELTNGDKIEDALNKMFTNTTNSTAKTTIDTWYNTNLSSYTSYIEDTVYCNDRYISNIAGWNPDGGNTFENNRIVFEPKSRYDSNTPSLVCSRPVDRFTVSNSIGNGSLTYPVGLITSDELLYAGGSNNNTNTTNYLYTAQDYWSISPAMHSQMGYSTFSAYVFYNASNGNIKYTNRTDETKIGLRPVISLSKNAVISGGDGTKNNPYTVQTN